MTFDLADALSRFQPLRQDFSFRWAFPLALPAFLLGWAQLLSAAEPAVISLAAAEMIAGSSPPVNVSLPISVDPEGDSHTAASRIFRWRVEVAQPARNLALYFPVLAARVQLRVNGQVVTDTLETPGPIYPRGADRILLQPVAESVWTSGTNTIELFATGPRGISVSAMELGPRAELAERQRRRVMGVVVGPFAAAVVVGSLGACMLLLWLRTK